MTLKETELSSLPDSASFDEIGSAQSHKSHQSHSVYTLTALTAGIGPISIADISGTPKGGILDLPTLYSPCRFQTNTELSARRLQALQFGSNLIVRKLDIDTKIFSRRLNRDVFPHFLTLLDDLLVRCIMVDTKVGTRYTVKKEQYKEILMALYKVQANCGNILLLNGDPVPKLPIWGRNGDVSHYHLENDYKIIAVCFRTEVENFLSIYEKYYNFIMDQPKDTDMIGLFGVRQDEIKKEPSSLQNYRRLNSERKGSDTMSINKQSRHESTIGPVGRRQSNFQNNPEGLGQMQSREKGKDKPSTKQLSHVLGNMGMKFTSQDSRQTKENSPSDGDDSSDGDSDPFPRNRGPPDRQPQIRNHRSSAATQSTQEPHFDVRLKFEDVPKWNGDTDTIIRWLIKINNLANMSQTVFTQLGKIVPRRLEGPAEVWYWLLLEDRREDGERDWDAVKTLITDYYMNRKWLDKQKGKAMRAYYREPGYQRETPSEYYIRKSELLTTVWNLSDSELILEIMEGAPANWNTILTIQLYSTTTDFQTAIKYYEDTLMCIDDSYRRDRPERSFRTFKNDREYSTSNKEPYVSKTYLIGSSKNLEPPKFPKDDSNISKKGFTPEEKGARPCRHCGSGKHWDYECRHSFKGMKRARANFGSTERDEENEEAQKEYDDLYYSLDSDGEDTDRSLGPVNSAYAINAKIQPVPISDQTEEMPIKTEVRNVAVRSMMEKPVLNRRSRRRLAREIGIEVNQSKAEVGKMIELTKYMPRPAGCSFLGAKATQTLATVGSPEDALMKVIIDSGSDITLISLQALEELLQKPKVKTRQKINLIQVTGTSSISRFIDINIYFHTDEGLVKIKVEAYVVNGMTTPFILGNDFADQYSISTIRKEGETYLEFGETGRQIRVENSTGTPLIDELGQVFKIRTLPELQAKGSQERRHRKNQKIRQRLKNRKEESEVRAAERKVVPPFSSCAVRVHAHTSGSSSHKQLLVERRLLSSKQIGSIFGAPDTMIDLDNPVLHISNFSENKVVISKGQILGQGRNPKNWLDKSERYDDKDLSKIQAHANLLKTLVQVKNRTNGTISSKTVITSKAQRNAEGEDDPTAQAAVKGGPKTSETPGDDIPSDRILSEIDISPDLSLRQKKEIENVVLRNKQAFGLDGRLGHFEGKVEIQMKPGTVPISLPPFPASPAKREVIDRQMDSWIELGVIEPSKSPWVAPVFIVYRNNKPQMVTDLRKFNEKVIPDEFPLPKQDDILQALNGAQWLTTLDVLAGFTQLTLTDSTSEKLAFRTHRGLWQFRRMPFGYRNGPSIFQRVMQNMLAPFLWIFALVYIDDIVIFSLNFEDHLVHLDKVFSAISQANITLSPPKCHLAYQSLLLLGQKVSRLGLSTHKEKVDAIVALEVPRDVSELQTFLGMMVYFASYVPFYAWIAHPLFQLLKKDSKWEWTELHQEAFDLCKQVLINAPIRGYARPGSPYRVYTDACDYGLAGILQQVQPIKIRDL